MTEETEPSDGNAETKSATVKPKTATASVTLAEGADDPYPSGYDPEEDSPEDFDG